MEQHRRVSAVAHAGSGDGTLSGVGARITRREAPDLERDDRRHDDHAGEKPPISLLHPEPSETDGFVFNASGRRCQRRRHQSKCGGKPEPGGAAGRKWLKCELAPQTVSRHPGPASEVVRPPFFGGQNGKEAWPVLRTAPPERAALSGILKHSLKCDL